MTIKVYAYRDNMPYKQGSIVGDLNFLWVDNPDEADFFYHPTDLGLLWRNKGQQAVVRFVRGLPYYQKHEERHFFHDYSDNYVAYGLKCIQFRANVDWRRKDPNVVAIPHTVEDFGEMSADFRTLPYDITFVGKFDSCRVRAIACRSIEADKSIRSFLRFYKEFYGYIENQDLLKERRQVFIEGLRQSRLVLSPRGVGLDAYRTYEAMSASRVPVWLGDDWSRPYPELVDYHSCSFTIREADADRTNEFVRHILAHYTAEDLQKMGRIAREY